MKPVLVLQHLNGDGPATLGRWLAARGVPVDVRNTEAGDAYPQTLAAHGALAILGGEMSANDALPSLRRAEALFLEALREGIPTLGHCLGGQLMARALGARIGASPAPEVGFNEVQLRPGAQGESWFGPRTAMRVFQWHFEAFDLPAGAEWLATSPACPHQAFALGPHLAMQFHIELDAEKLGRWSRDEGQRYREALARHPATVHEGERMRRDAAVLLPDHEALAARIYGRWLAAAGQR
ncbi:MAG: type 1 glutamine amidotransferase [Burkholderiales bacterium]|nr:type 1 glutamine amidotransferase [Burkholderiales bacterium]